MWVIDEFHDAENTNRVLKEIMAKRVCTHPEWIYRNTENGIVKVGIKCEQPIKNDPLPELP